jgi:hypothetical protein
MTAVYRLENLTKVYAASAVRPVLARHVGSAAVAGHRHSISDGRGSTVGGAEETRMVGGR